MVPKIRNQLIGFTIGKKKRHFIISLGDGNFFFLSKELFHQKRYFTGQFILGKLETYFSSFIKYKVVNRLKIDYSIHKNKYKIPFITKLKKIPRKFLFLLTIWSKFDKFFKNISKFFEFKILIGINGLISFQGNRQYFLKEILCKSFFQYITSL